MCVDSWYQYLIDRVSDDPEYEECVAAVKQAEPAFQALRESLTEVQWKALEDYFCACEEMDYCLLRLSWDIARERGIEDHLAREKRLQTMLKDVREHGPMSRAAEEALERDREEQTPEFVAMKERLQKHIRELEAEGHSFPPIDWDK